MSSDTAKMPEQSIYQKIVDAYLENGSVRETVHETGVSEVTVRRVLITEELWSSKTSGAVNELLHQGLSVPEIAQELSVTEKAVQAYLPYTKGMYGVEQTQDSKNSRDYRQRNALAKEKMSAPKSEEEAIAANRDTERKQEEITASDQDPCSKQEIITLADQDLFRKNEEVLAVEQDFYRKQYGERVKKERDELRRDTAALWEYLRPDERTIRNCAGRELLRETFGMENADPETAGALFENVKNRVNDEALGLPDHSGKVYQLHIELEASGLDMVSSYHAGEEERIEKEMKERFCRCAKAQNGIARDILVPGNMTLHALHYAIMRLFGFLGYHLHNFELTDEDLKRVTAARAGGYKDLCGILFRFPDMFESDDSWDDDYDGKGSIKTWYKKKYSAPFRRAGLSDTWYANVRAVEAFSAEHPEIPDEMLVDELKEKHLFEGQLDCLAEDLTVQELFTLNPWGYDDVKEAAAWKAQILGKSRVVEAAFSNMLKDGVEDAADIFRGRKRRRRPEADARETAEEQKKQIDETCRKLDRMRDSYGTLCWYMEYDPEMIQEDLRSKGTNVQEQVWCHERDIRNLTETLDFLFQDYNVHPAPAFREIRYRYDFGNDWQFHIRAEEIYTREQEDMEPALMDGKQALEELRYTDHQGNAVNEELRGKLAEVDVKKKPACIAADGLNMVEDAGGVHGLYDFFASVNGPQESEEEREERAAYLEWARGLGWTGRMSKPENML